MGAGLWNCWFMTEMVGETRPYENWGTHDRFCSWVGAGLLYCWFLTEMVGETRPYENLGTRDQIGRAHV